MTDIDKEIEILENIYSQPEKVRQRDLAHIAGISLGMTNSILKRLIKKGLLTTKKINPRNIHYAVTPSGINEIMQRSYRYFKRTIKNIAEYKEKIEQLIIEIKVKGFDKVILVGKSDLGFIVEHCCELHQIHFSTKKDQSSVQPNTKDHVFYVFSENITLNSRPLVESSIGLFEKFK
ncbi:MAG: winged helix-turn-helix transcriptional regulator [Spirochaetales bacterium]|nr:winged helix-turn-helix transcriptional regulator [Spirochaetales bacterium]